MSTNETSLQTLKTQLAKGGNSLSLRDRKATLALRAQNNILLLDTSYSMNSPADGHQSRIDILWDLVQSLRLQNLPFRVCQFNSTADWSDMLTKPRPDQSTALAEAFDFIGSARPSTVTLITDGQPDNIPIALAAGEALGCPINVLYVGPSSDYYCLEFCRDLASRTGGVCQVNSLATELLQLQAAQSAKEMLLLSQHVSTDTREKVISL